jgi:hypothetical protein
MITPKELLIKSEKLFFKVLSAHYKGESIFPIVIPSNKNISGSNFSDWNNDLIPLFEQSKAAKGKGYTVDWTNKKINGSSQSMPTKIYFESLEDFLYFTHRTQDYQKITEARKCILLNFPTLLDWVNANSALVLENYEQWNDLMKVCKYFTTHTLPHPFYIRELPIEVHSKFIEQNTALLKKLLDQLLPPDWVKSSETDFSLRYSLKKVQVYTQIRILDDDLKPYLGYDECSLTLDDAAWLKWTPEKVFIIENQTCFLTFPKVKNAVAIFGEGFKSRLSKHLPWLDNTRLICWFDLDAAGFEMLHMIREHYPKSESFLMDLEAYTQFSHFSVTNIRRKSELACLSDKEQECYKFLMENKKRLEQEKITQQYVQYQLYKLVSAL